MGVGSLKKRVKEPGVQKLKQTAPKSLAHRGQSTSRNRSGEEPSCLLLRRTPGPTALFLHFCKVHKFALRAISYSDPTLHLSQQGDSNQITLKSLLARLIATRIF